MSGKYPLTSFAEHFAGQIDLLICSASYEERCKVVADAVSPLSVKKVLVCENHDLIEVVGSNSQYLQQRFASVAQSVQFHSNKPLQIADALSSSLDAAINCTTKKVIVDITTFTREGLLILLGLLRSKASSKITVNLIYVAAADYSIGDTGKHKWLSTGVESIRSVLGYSGNLTPSRKTHLIVLAGFEHKRAEEVIKNYEASIVSVGFGSEKESISAEHHKTNRVFYQEIIASYININEFDFSLIDPLSTKESIEKQINKHPDFNVVIAPLNNKISTLGVAYVAFDNPNVQLCYAQPNRYNFVNYSVPGKEFYWFKMP
ncbi:MAG: hypothetical protein MSG64_02865 [Pyrinomonadaceae bacterium MAG19_C2-C3]|nr:hypothetical protein [Pyrinomonadaceae bacterium MAG19_C2-C3]